MNEDGKDDEERFYKVIRDMLTEAMKNGRFPSEGNFSITIAGGNLPIDIIPPEFTGIQEESKNPAVKEIKPHTEVHKMNNEIIISADLPGAKEEDTAIAVEDDFLIITSLSDNVRFSARVKIPPIKKETMKHVLKNGLLEISAIES
ncbi:MAG: Hsp20/alpha crystallin family protein [Methanomicrobiaceae archaeon]|nr:Hsp20/alpha crystallin family protein [Methanomicrobiaceae archaeon]